MRRIFHPLLRNRSIFLIFGLFFLCGVASATEKVSHHLFENVRSEVLGNGMQVIVAPRNTSDSVTLLLSVNVGLRDFPCEKQQIPHVIEHLLFENNTKYSPEELRNRIRDAGGSSNGWTNPDHTLVTVSIHSDYEQDAIATLATMIQDLRWDESDMKRVKRIVDSEIETPVSPIQRWFDSKRSVMDIAKGKLYPGTNLDCPLRSEAGVLSSAEIMSAFETYYKADNMVLIVVGNVSDDTSKWIAESFGNIKNSGRKPSVESRFDPGHIPLHNEKIIEKGGYGNAQAWVNLLARMPGIDDPDFAAAQILTEYFNERLYAEVRLKYGLGYTPNAYLDAGNESSEMVATTKTRSDLYESVENIFIDIYRDLRTEEINDADLNRIKRKLTLKFEAKERDASDIAMLYEAYRSRLLSNGSMPDLVKEYNAVTQKDIARIIDRYLPEEPLIALLRPPSPIEAGMAVAGIIFGAAILGWPLNRWIQRRRKHQQHTA